jgi:membrane protease YdiL (CAAX protease family)
VTLSGSAAAPVHVTDRLHDRVRVHPLRAYFIVTFGFSWLVEVVAFGLLEVPVTAGLIVAAFGPPIAAFVVTQLTQEAAGLRAFAHRLVQWRVGGRWYAFGLVGIPVLGLLSFVFLPDGTDNLPDPPALIVPTYLALVVVMMLFGGGQEEPGWRGFALTPLQTRFGPLRASILIGVIWAVWHLPLFILVEGYDNAGSGVMGVASTFVGFVGYTVSLALMLTWVFNRTGGSVFMAMLLHGSLNAVFALAPETTTAVWCLSGAYALLAVIIAIITHGRLGHQDTPCSPVLADQPPNASQSGLSDATAVGQPQCA